MSEYLRIGGVRSGTASGVEATAPRRIWHSKPFCQHRKGFTSFAMQTRLAVGYLRFCGRSYLKACRNRNPQRALDSDFDLSEVAVQTENESEFNLEQFQQRLNELPDNYRFVLLISYLEGKS